MDPYRNAAPAGCEERSGGESFRGATLDSLIPGFGPGSCPKTGGPSPIPLAELQVVYPSLDRLPREE